MNTNRETGIVTIASHQSVDRTVEALEHLLQAKGGQAVCPSGSQWRGGKGRHANAPHPVHDFAITVTYPATAP